MNKGEENEWVEHQALVGELRIALHRDYDSSVLGRNFHWELEGARVRGPNYEAQIHLEVEQKQEHRTIFRCKGKGWVQ